MSQNPPTPVCIHDLFQEQTDRTPDAIAVTFGPKRLTYNELNIRSNYLAARLQTMGVGPEVLVAVCVNRSDRMATALLATLKAGGAYVPLDPQFPGERLKFMIEDSQASVLITEKSLADALPAQRPQTLCLDSDELLLGNQPKPPRSETRPHNLAYVIYTSGSTGTPKGVEIEHRSVVNFLASMRREPGISPRDRLLAVTTLSFDIAGLEIFLPLVSGAQLTIAPRSAVADGAALANLLRESAATMMQATPATWRLLLDAGWKAPPGFKMLCGGEALPRELAARLLGAGGELWNLYGPTETTIWSTIHRVDWRQGSVPIGKPIANTQAHVLDEHRQAVAPGTAGELYIGGDGLARGYLRRPTTTNERFIVGPLGPGGRLYRTGDLARVLPDGNLEYLGREDQQIKLRGFRIELGEIEAVLEQQASVRQAVVVVREDEPGDQRLIAYVVSEGPRDAAVLRTALAARLPEYMLPSAIVFLDAFPLTPNKKVDRKALPRPVVETNLRQELAGTETQKRLAELWRTLLKVPAVGLHDNFFALGGHSLLMVQCQSRIRREFSRELSITELFERPTVAQVAELLESGGAPASPVAASEEIPGARDASSFAISSIQPASRGQTAPLSSAQMRLWFLDQLTPGSGAYVVPMAVRLRGELDLPVLERTLLEIVGRHEALRTIFPAANGAPQQVIVPLADVSLNLIDGLIDLSTLPVADRETRAHQIANDAAREPFDLSAGPLFRTRLLRLDAGDHALIVTVHHIVFDAWSVEIFWQEFSTLYSAFRADRPSPLADLPIQLADFAAWQRSGLDGEGRESHKAYWTTQLSGSPAALDLPRDKPRKWLRAAAGARKMLRIPPEINARLKFLSQGEGASLFMTLLAALKILLYRLSGQNDILVGTPIAGRNRVELEEMIGFFVNTIVVRTHLAGASSFRELLAQVRKTVLEGHEHQDMPFEELVEALDPERDLSRTPLFQVFFNHLNGQLTPVEIPRLTVEPLLEFELASKFDLTVYVGEQNDALYLNMVYNGDLFDESRMSMLLDQYSALLEQICDDPNRSLADYSLLTDSMRDLIPDPSTTLESRWSGSVHSKFVQRAAETPRRTAIVEAGARWSYGRLDTVSDGLAAWLEERQVGSGDVVAVYGERSATLVVAMLGILRAGAVFCILDPSYPDARLAKCVRAVRPKVWLQLRANDLPPQLEAAIAETAGTCRLTIRRGREAFSMRELSGRCQSRKNVDPDSPAYVTFTSGTTGEPKCILSTHRPIAHFIDWHVRQFGLKNTDRFSMMSGLAHDPLLRDVFTPLSLGATLVIPSQDDILAPGRLLQWMEQQNITVSHLTPAINSVMAGTWGEPQEVVKPLASLRYAFFGGDTLTSRDITILNRRAPNVRCVNFYGATETPQAMAWHPVEAVEAGQLGSNWPANTGSIPLGAPISDVQLLIMNSAGRLAGMGELGEIHVRTPYLSRGYANDEALTRTRFLTNPFTGNDGDRIYRTGDLGRYRPDGLVEFAGRADTQVKIRGHRIEIGEIEAALARHPGVADCAVLARDDSSEGKRLAAFFVARNGQGPISDELRASLKSSLPDFMIPAAFVELSSLPLTPNGKVDRRALAVQRIDRTRSVAEYALPGSRVEHIMIEIWRDVLGIDQVSVFDNFFELGGHSLSATRLIARLQSAFRIDLPLRCIFIEPTVAGLAAHIRYDNLTQKYSYLAEIPRWKCMVPAQPRGTRTPFFFVAGYQGADDTLLVLSRFLAHLGLDQPVYGFRPRWMEGVGEAYSSVAEAASEFLTELRSVQPKGPYLLGGQCVGGVVAFEIAQQLLRQGEEVKLLALLDTERPTSIRATLANVRLNWRRTKHIADVISEIIHSDHRLQAVRELARRKARTAHPESPGQSPADRLYHLIVGYRRLAYRYAAQPYPGRITLIVNEQQYQLDKDLGWKGIGAGLDVYTLPGDHDSVLPLHGREFAQVVRKCMDEVLPEPAPKAGCAGVGA